MSKAPVPKKIPKKLVSHGDIRIDNYYWLRDDSRANKEVISYLEKENKYTEDWFSKRKDYKTEIYEEMVNKIPNKETSLKVKRDDFYYFSEIFSNEQYSRYYREQKNKKKELLLDLNTLSKNKEYFSISGISPSPDHSLIAYGEDLSGRREFNLKIKDLSTNKIIDESIFNSSGNVVWDNSNEFIFYTKKDPKTLITNKVFKHKLGDKQENDLLIYQENDPEFNLGISKSRLKKYLFINISKTESSETWILDLAKDNAKPICFLKRQENHLYGVTENDDCFYVITNIDTFKDYFYLETREDGLPNIKKIKKDDLSVEYIKFDDPAYSSYLTNIGEYSSEEVFYGYSSPNCQSTVFKENHKNGKREKVWTQDLSNFDSSL